MLREAVTGNCARYPGGARGTEPGTSRSRGQLLSCRPTTGLFVPFLFSSRVEIDARQVQKNTLRTVPPPAGVARSGHGGAICAHACCHRQGHRRGRFDRWARRARPRRLLGDASMHAAHQRRACRAVAHARAEPHGLLCLSAVSCMDIRGQHCPSTLLVLPGDPCSRPILRLRAAALARDHD